MSMTTTLVVAARSADVLAATRDPQRVLSDVERARAASFRRAEDARDFVAAHILARMCAARLSGDDWEGLRIEQRCARCGGAHGKPVVRRHPGLELTISRTAGNVAAAASARAVGIDVERLAADRVLCEAAAGFFTSGELEAARAAPDPQLALLRQWVRKECLVKLGLVSLDTMREFDLSEVLVEEARNRATARQTVWGDYCVLDWLDPLTGVLGSAVSALPCRLVTLHAVARTARPVEP